MDGPGGPTDSAPHQIVDRSCLPVQKRILLEDAGVDRECPAILVPNGQLRSLQRRSCMQHRRGRVEEVLPGLVSVKVR